MERELSRPEYHRSPLDRFVSWLGDLWDGLTQAATARPRGPTAAAVVLLVLRARVARGRRRSGTARAGPAPRRRRRAHRPARSRPRRTAAAAEGALSDGRPDDAIVEAFRALASRSLRRGLVEARPGLTAHELAADLSAAFPAARRRLGRAALLFDAVFYGHQPATADDARSVLALDETLRTARPARHDAYRAGR